MKRLAILFAALLLASLTAGSVAAGNGAPSGPHYNLNVIAVENAKTASMTDSERHTIFVPLTGNCQIKLAESLTGEFNVLDGNCFDSDAAKFELPDPDPNADGVTTYSVFARALGSPKDNPFAHMRTCGIDPADPQNTICSVLTLELKRTTGKQQFENVSKYLLYVYADIGGTMTRVPLFSDTLKDYFWDYQNSGLRLAQLRFYPGVCTMVPAATAYGDDQQIVECTGS